MVLFVSTPPVCSTDFIFKGLTPNLFSKSFIIGSSISSIGVLIISFNPRNILSSKSWPLLADAPPESII